VKNPTYNAEPAELAEHSEQKDSAGSARSALIVVFQRPVRIMSGMHSGLPGRDLIDAGIADLGRGVESIAALLVSIGAPRLRQLGFDVPAVIADPEHRLYQLLASENSDAAHSRYNALVRRLVSFERAAECAG
jgi:hypothetical protein